MLVPRGRNWQIYVLAAILFLGFLQLDDQLLLSVIQNSDTQRGQTLYKTLCDYQKTPVANCDNVPRVQFHMLTHSYRHASTPSPTRRENFMAAYLRKITSTWSYVLMYW